MDTVLGLSLTSTAVGWVLVEGRDADGAIVDHDDFAVRTGGGARAIKTAERVTAAVQRALTLANRRDQRVRVIGLTWCDDASAEAALLLESLTNAGLDNVVPIQALQAAALLGQGMAPVVGCDNIAVCVLDGDSTIVVTVDGPNTAVENLPGGPDRLIDRLTAVLDRDGPRPGGVVLVSTDHDLDPVSRRLEKALPVTVFTQSGVELALARGAALASAHSTQFTDAAILESIQRDAAAPTPSRVPSSAGALTMLAAGAVTFVASLSLAVGPQLVPDREPAAHPAHRPAPAPVLAAPAPAPVAVTAPTPQAAPAPAPPDEPVAAAPPIEQQSGVTPEPPADVPAEPPVAAPEPPPPPLPPVEPPPPNPHPLLAKLLERLHGHPDPEPDGPAPPPAPGAPSP